MQHSKSADFIETELIIKIVVVAYANVWIPYLASNHLTFADVTIIIF